MSENIYKLRVQEPIPEHLWKQIISKFAYVDEMIMRANISDDGKQIQFELNTELNDNIYEILTRKTEFVVHEMTKGFVKPRTEILEDHRNRPIFYKLDPMEQLLEMGEASEEEQGIYTFGTLVSKLQEYFQAQFARLAEEFSADHYSFPTLMSAKMLDRVGYFKAFPHSLTFATHLREDLNVISDFSEKTVYNPEGLNAEMGSFAKIKAMLSPAVCYHLYFSIADSQIKSESMVATATGSCFRYESNNLNSMERLWNFTMQEVIFIGTKDFVLERRNQSREFMQKIFSEIGLAYVVETANDPFFIGEFRKQTAFQNAFQLKYEIQANLPFKEGSLAIGSYNYHQDFFGRNLNITLPDGSPIHTGCAAFGLERVVFAFLAQFGFDQRIWPEDIRRAVSG